jgi:hypothetical protein
MPFSLWKLPKGTTTLEFVTSGRSVAISSLGVGQFSPSARASATGIAVKAQTSSAQRTRLPSHSMTTRNTNSINTLSRCGYLMSAGPIGSGAATTNDIAFMSATTQIVARTVVGANRLATIAACGTPPSEQAGTWAAQPVACACVSVGAHRYLSRAARGRAALARALGLNRRARHRPVRAEHATIARLWF